MESIVSMMIPIVFWHQYTEHVLMIPTSSVRLVIMFLIFSEIDVKLTQTAFSRLAQALATGPIYCVVIVGNELSLDTEIIQR